MNAFAEAMANVAAAAEMLKSSSGSVAILSSAMSSISAVKVTDKSFGNLADGIRKVGQAAESLTTEALNNLADMAESLYKLQGVDLKGLGSAMNAVRRNNAPKTPVVEEEEVAPFPPLCRI